MNLNFNIDLAEGYKSNSQIARVLTENWVKENSYCPNCGELSLNDFENNMPVADFHCINCKEEFEELNDPIFNYNFTNNKVEIEYKNVSNDGHYKITPYSFKPKVAIKINNKESQMNFASLSMK